MELRHVIAVGEPRSTVLLLHGFGEHSARYSHIIEIFAEAGYDVFSYDQAGHGRAAGPRAQVDMPELLKDHRAARAEVMARKRTDTLVLFGHSMGGLITGMSALIDPRGVDAVVLSGPAFRQFPEVAPIIAKIGYGLSRFLPSIPIANIDTKDLSRDLFVVRAYERDPLVHHGWVPMLTGTSMAVHGRKALDNASVWKKSLPLYVVHGEDDQMANIEGSREFVTSVKDSGSPAELVTVPAGFHEVLNEPDSEQVVEDIIQWLNNRV